MFPSNQSSSTRPVSTADLMRRYFISDLHLSPNQALIADGFKRFLHERCADADELYILGDFFDSWIGDDEDDAFYRNIIAFLRAISSDGLKLYLMRGNRDFLLGEQFAQDSGVTLLAEPHRLRLGKLDALLMHGDSLCTDDKDYMAFRAQARSAEWQAQVLGLPLAARRALAEQMRSQSKTMNSNKAEDIMDVNADAVSACMSEHRVSLLIHGHTHRPARHTLTGGERIVLGDWGAHAWYLRSEDESLTLHQFALAKD